MDTRKLPFTRQVKTIIFLRMEIEVSKNLAFFSVEAGAVSTSLLSKAGFVRYKDGKYYTPFIRLARMLLKRSIDLGPAIEVRRKRSELSNAETSTFKPKCHDHLEPMGYQRAAVEFVVNNPYGYTCLFDDMGLGKTVETILSINTLVAMGRDIEWVLIVCPASVKINWAREYRKWSTCDNQLDIQIITNKTEKIHGRVCIVNYDILHSENISNLIRSFRWDVMVMDESHRVKNKKARCSVELCGGQDKRKGQERGWKVKKPIRPLVHGFLLTGTPILNRPIELFPLLKYALPLGFSNEMRFARRYCGAYKNNFGYWDFSGNSNLEELQGLLRSTIMVRREKSKVLKELPPKTRQVIELDPTKLTKKKLKTQNDFMSVVLGGAPNTDRLDDSQFREVIKCMEKGEIAGFEEISEMRKQLAIDKLPMVLAHIKDALQDTDEKIILFSHHKEVARAIAEEFGEICVTVTGDTNEKARQSAVDRFQDDAKVRLFNGNLLAAGVGLTLIAARWVMFIEIDWRPGMVIQAEDRAHRYGQKDNVFVQFLVVPDSLESYMAHTVIGKLEVSDKALNK